jgi:anti-anti-sigma regulatory factor
MLTITVQADMGIISLRGRLAGLHVPEVEKSWRTTAFAQPGRRIVVDLAAVSFIDVLGKELLRRIHRQGNTLVPGGVMTQDVIEEITRDAQP